MKTDTVRRLVCLVLFTAGAPAALAHEPTVSAGTLRAELDAEFADVEKKLVSLAEAVPQEKFGWRPAEVVRSVSEVYMHVASGNYFIPSFAGAQRPADAVNRDMEKTVTDKAKVVEALKKSFAHARKSLAETSDFDKMVKMFGRDKSARSVYLLLLNHAHEHLGQSIAYARSNGIAPPWSESEKPAPPKPAGN